MSHLTLLPEVAEGGGLNSFPLVGGCGSRCGRRSFGSRGCGVENSINLQDRFTDTVGLLVGISLFDLVSQTTFIFNKVNYFGVQCLDRLEFFLQSYL